MLFCLCVRARVCVLDVVHHCSVWTDFPVCAEAAKRGLSLLLLIRLKRYLKAAYGLSEKRAALELTPGVPSLSHKAEKAEELRKLVRQETNASFDEQLPLSGLPGWDLLKMQFERVRPRPAPVVLLNPMMMK